MQTPNQHRRSTAAAFHHRRPTSSFGDFYGAVQGGSNFAFGTDRRCHATSTNPFDRLTGEIKRRTNVVGIFPNEHAITRLFGAILLERNDEWAVQRGRYMSLETIAPLSDDT